MKTKFFTKHNALMHLVILLLINIIITTNNVVAQVAFVESTVITDEALFFWKADDPKPYHYGSAINPHGNCVKVVNGYVFYTWYRGGFADRTLMVSRKKIGEGEWVHVALPGKMSLVGGKGDTHHTTNIGICPIDGTVHIMYDHHNEDLNYIVSKKNIAFAPNNEFSANNFLPQRDYLIPGKKVTGVTYPKLFNNDAGEMFFERRLGSAVGGEIVMTYYNGEYWTPEKTIINGRGGVTQGERNFAYGDAFFMNGKFYYSYSPRWAESPTILNEGVYLMDLGPQMDKTATAVNGKSYNLPITDHAPFLIADPRSVPDNEGWSGGPQVAISPKNDTYLRINPKGTNDYSYLRKAGETEFAEYRNKGTLGEFFGNRMYRFATSGGVLTVESCLAGTFEWRTDFTLNTGINVQKSQVEMENGKIVAIFAERKSSDKVPIHCYVFDITKSEYTAQTITFDALANKIESDDDFELSATATSGLPVKFSSSNTNIARIIDGNKVQIMGVGTCNIVASQKGKGEFDNAPEVVRSLTIKANTAKTNQTIQFALPSSDYVWESGDIALNATASSGLPVQYESSDTLVAVVVDGKVKVKRAGQTTINALQPGNETLNAAPIVSQELNVPKQTQVITFEEIPEKYSGDAEFTLLVSSNNPNAKLRYVCPNNQVAVVWSSTVRHLLGPGNATITVSDEGDDYFTPTQTSRTLTVKPKTHVIPKLIEAEHYTTKSSSTHVTRWSNSIFYLNQFAPNQFAEYTIDVPADGNYTIEVRTAAPNANSRLKVMSGTSTLATISLTQSPNLTVFRTTKASIPLIQGIQQLRFVGVANSYNFDSFTITEGGGTIVVPSGDDDPDLDPMPYTIISVDEEQIPNVAANLFDGNTSDDSRWSANGYPKSVVIDLGEVKEIIGTRLWTLQSRAYQYKVELSNSASDGFVQVVNRLSNTSSVQPISDDFEMQKGRYVRLTVEGCHAYTGGWVSITELVLVFKNDETSVRSINELADWVGVYPNPTNSGFKISLKGVENAQVQIFSISGQMIYNKFVSQEPINLPVGVYMLRAIGSNQKVYNQKLIVK